ncbi:MAG: hypothetical protein WCI51_10280 [Lentisphaerota bacterium]
MHMTNIIFIGVFWTMQIVAQLFFKWGSSVDSRWIWGFLIGNLFGFSSIWLLMMVYKSMNPNIALAICGGGAFLLSQLVMAIVFRSQVSLTQWLGVFAIVIGMAMLAIGKPAGGDFKITKMEKRAERIQSQVFSANKSGFQISQRSSRHGNMIEN